jgi:prepilin-type N-terminal cleavage/methylation domain-containing protein
MRGMPPIFSRRDKSSARPAPAGACRGAFTLIELLVVLAIVGALVAILVPNLAQARSRAKRAVCASNLRTLGLATTLYLESNDGQFFRYYTDIAAADTTFSTPGRQWWFGFEPGGPGTGANRPLDKSLSPLAPYTAELSSKMQCPDFPYDGGYFSKFDQHAASYGLNVQLAPISGGTASRAKYMQRMKDVFVFADGVHFDSNPGFNEAHYIKYTNPLTLSGYAHFRHQKEAQYVLLDGHVEAQPLGGPAFRFVVNGNTGNLTGADGAGTHGHPPDIYGSP